MIYFTELESLAVFDVKGEYLGRLVDLCVDPSQNALRVALYLVKAPKGGILRIPYDQVQSISVLSIQTAAPAGSLSIHAPDEGLLRVKKDVLDQQVIDVNHRKVVRVNDVDFDIQPSDGHAELRIVAANVGFAAALRRLLQGAVAKHNIRTVSGLFPSKTIPWEFVNLIEADRSRRVKLRISYDRLAKLHPADIADILEELSRDEQQAVVEGLDDETAAEVLAGMEKDEAKEVRALLGFEEHTAGALMTTEFIMVGENATVDGAIAALRNFEGKLDSVHMIYLLGAAGVLTGVVSLAHILLAQSATPLKELSTEPVITVQAHADQETVVDLFHKYNLVTLPVVDEKARLLGIITADDDLELVVNRS